MRNAVGAILAVLLVSGAVAAYRTTDTVQIGYNGVGMIVFDTEERLETKLEANQLPPALPAADTTGPLAVDAYENVQVLGHLTAAQFTRLMTAITLWVSPEQGCAYCHNTENLASDELYTKVVSRRMIQMTMHLNENWQSHVQQTGVTCYSCHRGNPVPEYIWYDQPPNEVQALGYRASQNQPAAYAGLASLPSDALQVFLDDDAYIRVQTDAALPTDNRSSIQQTEWTYALMMHMSNALGVNCTYCHNSRAWEDWSQSPAQRATAWYGIRMVRDVNNAYLEPLREVFPDYRLGPEGDVPKTNCTTCHQGAYKPLLGQSMLQDYAELARAVEQPEKIGVTVGDRRIDVTGSVHFATGSDEILARSNRLLEAVRGAITGDTDIVAMQIVGHTDVTGDVEGNQSLSERRAQAVVRYLVARGVGITLVAVGEGQNRPLCTELTPECNARNRRVEFQITQRASDVPAEGVEGEVPAEGAPPPAPADAPAPAAN